MGTLGHTSREGLGEWVSGCPAVRACLDQRAARLQALLGLRTRTEPRALSGTLEELYCALGRRWDTARSGDVLCIFSPAESALAVVPKRVRGAITDTKEAGKLTSNKAWNGSRRSKIADRCCRATHKTLVPPAQLSDSYAAVER